mmetsp:Transcript_5486/g.15745  ORF Transcript_5486/g.15745 Transcript_5486/m.15745 type:complete len:211 (-) Transcript_5486:178-810(-)|eukprot:CAMPEP_0194490664 /NCGR_PEP_ID=MMETSP0253-20130528/9812_1 /TAXON_ID=2966 /ORGANISM="Noctiluca scintillans" /LENGTH=210 /DNA_ID=CAMNT_0039331321 /DNA_START=85 /DNA_END=717 /DNA_ORIENTATION=-
MTVAEEQILRAEEYKTAGNNFFKESDFPKALSNYHKVFLYLNALSDPNDPSKANKNEDIAQMAVNGAMTDDMKIPPERSNDVRKLKGTTYVNMATCYMSRYHQDPGPQSNKWLEKVVDVCQKALVVIGPSGIASSSSSAAQVYTPAKAYFKLGQASLLLNRVDEASDYLKSAQEWEPNDTAIQAEMIRVRKRTAEQDRQERQRYKGMFAK